MEEFARPSQQDALLVADGVRKIYWTGDLSVLALDDLDLTVRAGELVAVMGPSGSGKTTLLNCLSGLDEIDAGHVLVNGRDLFAMSDHDRTEHRARSMGFVFQSYNLIPVFTAVENVEAPLFQSATVRRSFYAESTFVAVEGVAIGTFLGVLTTWLLYQNSPSFGSLNVPYPIAWTQLAIIIAGTLTASLLATIGPARRAARIRPAVALRITD